MAGELLEEYFNLFCCSGGTGQTQPSPPPTHPAQRTTGNGRIKQTLKNSKTPKLIFSSPHPVSKPLMKPNRTFEEEKIKQKESLPAKFLGIFFYFLMYR